MADLEATLSLDIFEALDQIVDLEVALTRALESGADALGPAVAAAAAEATAALDEITITPQVDTAPAVAETDAAFAAADPVVEPTIDPSAIEGQLALLDSALEVTPELTPGAVEEQLSLLDTEIEIEPVVDTAAAEEQLSGLTADFSDVGQAATGAGASFDGAALGAAALAQSANVLQGDVSGLGAAFGGIAPEVAAAAVGVGAFVGGIGVLFNAALDAEGVLFRFKNTLGEFADEVEQVNVAGLDTNITDLAISLGSNDEAIRSAAASFFQMGEASGVAGDQVAVSTEQLIALAARAVALNPALGEVGDVASGLSRGLARGGRFAAQYGIALTSAEISARALADTGKATAGELTIYEKAAAGAALATEKYGDTLAETVATGIENPLLQVRSLRAAFDEFVETLGAPFVAPILELLPDLIPVIEALAVGFAEFALPLVEAFAELADAAAPLLQVLAPIVAAVARFNAVTSPFILGMRAAAVALNVVTAAVEFVVDIVDGPLTAAFEFLEPIVSAIGDGFRRLAPFLLILVSPLAILATAFVAIGRVAQVIIARLEPLAPVLSAAAEALVFLATQATFIGEITRALTALGAVAGAVGDGFAALAEAPGALLDALRGLGSALTDVAIKDREVLSVIVRSFGSLLVLIDNAIGALGQLGNAFGSLASAADAALGPIDEILGGAAGFVGDLAGDVAGAIGGAVSDVAGAVGGFLGIGGSAAAEVEQIGDSAEEAAPRVEALTDSVEGVNAALGDTTAAAFVDAIADLAPTLDKAGLSASELQAAINALASGASATDPAVQRVNDALAGLSGPEATAIVGRVEQIAGGLQGTREQAVALANIGGPALIAAEAAFAQFTQTAINAVPGVEAAFARATDAFAAFGAALTPAAFTDSLNAQFQATANFVNNVAALYEAGFTELGDFLLDQGAENGANLAQGLVESGPEVQAAANQAVVANILQQIGTPEQLAEARRRGASLGKEGAEGVPEGAEEGSGFFGDFVDRLFGGGEAETTARDAGAAAATDTANAATATAEVVAPPVGEAFDAGVASGIFASSAIVSASATTMLLVVGTRAAPQARAVGQTVGAQLDIGVATGITNFDFAIQAALTVALLNAAGGQGGLAFGLGQTVGQAFANGIAIGIVNNQDIIEAAARTAALAAFFAAMRALDASSPSRLAMEIGEAFNQGYAAGIDQSRDIPEDAARDTALATLGALAAGRAGTLTAPLRARGTLTRPATSADGTADLAATLGRALRRSSDGGRTTTYAPTFNVQSDGADPQQVATVALRKASAEYRRMRNGGAP